MITNKGSDIIARYLLGQAPEFAAYIAVGCGAKPLANQEVDDSSPIKKTMDFEAFRIPVISKGIVNDSFNKTITSISTTSGISIATSTSHGINIGQTVIISIPSNTPETFSTEVIDVTNDTFTFASPLDNGTISPLSATVIFTKDRLIFKAQLPPDQKYEMTEIALYPAINNQLAVGHDSKILLSFSDTEPWSLFGSNETISLDSSSISNQVNAINTFSAKYINSDNLTFYGSSIRKSRYEQPRFLNKCLILNGGLCSFTNFDANNGSIYLSNTSLNIDLSKYASTDVIKLAISVVSENEISSPPASTKIRLDFVDPDNKIISMRKLITANELSTSRYIVLSSTITDLYVPDQTFNWAKIIGVNIYAETLNESQSYDGSYIILDGLRIDDENITNPLYGMVAYSKLKNSYIDAMPIEKVENSQGYIEYRLGVAIT